MNIFKKGAALCKQAVKHWKVPPDGRYMPFREIFAYSVGGIGAYSIFTMAQALLLSTTNVIIGNTVGIQPMHMYVMYVISVITNIPLTMVRANMVDNVKYKEGKYRPYLLRMGIPTVAISLAFVFTPYSMMGYVWRCVFIFVYNFGLQFFYNFFYDAYENLIHVLSPNSQERTDTTAIKSVIYSFSPTVTNFVTPLIADKVADGNMYDLRVYRWLYPFIAVVGVALIVLVYARTKEKIIVARTHPMKIRFTDALREVAKNKYFWIISLAGWLGFLETATYVILQWLYNYGHLCTAEQYAMITFIKGTAYTWGMVLAPFAIKRWGKKRVLIVTNVLNVVFLAMIYPMTHSIWMVLLCVYFNSVADSFILVLNPAIQADIRDYQHYKSGERIDGMFGAVAMIGSFITMATSSVLPAVYEKYGIFKGNGYKNMYDVLYDTTTLYKLIGVLVLLSAVGAALNTVPYFFYDLTEVKQKAVIRILRVRAAFEDFGNGALSEDQLRGILELIAGAEKAVEGGKRDLAALKKSGADKKTLKAAAAANEEYEISVYVLRELGSFSTPEARARLKRAEAIKARGENGVFLFDRRVLDYAKALPAGTQTEREIRRQAIADARLALRSLKAAKKYYPDGIKTFDAELFDRLCARENELEQTKTELLRQKAPKDEIKRLSLEQAQTEKKIKAMTLEHQRYADSVKAYTDAEKYVSQAENYARFGQAYGITAGAVEGV